MHFKKDWLYNCLIPYTVLQWQHHHQFLVGAREKLGAKVNSLPAACKNWRYCTEIVKFCLILTHLKALMPITFSSPRAQSEVVYFFLYQMKAHILLIANPKFQLQILCSFWDITKSVKLNGIPENNFLCIFIIASSPGVHTFFCLWRVNKKLPQGETSQNAFQRSGQSIKSEKYVC